MKPTFLLPCIVTLLLTAIMRGDPIQRPGYISGDFIYETAPIPECHASTIVETSDGLVAAWFGGTREKNADVTIWVSRHVAGRWSAPVSVADGVQADGKQYPCWNPVLFQSRGGPLMLFYKVGPNPDAWWGMVRTSTDSGATWSDASRLPDGILGPVRNKPVQLDDGTIVSPSSTEDQGWRAHFELSTDRGATWTKTAPVPTADPPGLIQPTLLRHPDGRLQALCRNRQSKGIYSMYSSDRGKSWSTPELTSLPNPNSGIDAVTLTDGRHLLVYNHVGGTPGQWGGRRSPLNVAVSVDGKEWQAALILEQEPKEYSYPAVIQARDGLVHITYTWERKRLRHVVVDPSKLALRAMVDGKWPD
jgi:predicted neuraminidase